MKRLRPGIWLGITALGLLFAPWSADAMPSYARQTGQACTACHMNFPELTPFGRAFKLGGYTLSSGESSFPPLSAALQPAFTHTQKSQPGGAAPHFGPNDNLSLELASAYYAGKIFENVGTFTQVNFNGIERKFSLDHTDIRYAQSGSIGSTDIAYGATLNNAPTIEDIYNTTNAYGFPFASPLLALRPNSASFLEGLQMQVGGLGAYALLDSTVYGAFTLYKTLPSDFQRATGNNMAGVNEIDTVAPYWRFALQREWDVHSASVGTFGTFANTNPGRMRSAGTDRFLDVGLDAQYQFRSDPHGASLQASWIHEDARPSASRALGLAANSSNSLDSFRIKTSYLYQDTYGATVAYFARSGTTDRGLFAPAPRTGSANGKPDTSGWIFELDWLPFMNTPVVFAPLAQLKLSLQYVAYNKFNGGTSNYDGSGRSASDNNTLFLLAWFVF